MSNAGQAVLTVVGTVVGAYFGYPQLGFVLGSLAGQALFPTQLPGVTGPQLTDRKTTSASVGDPVVWIHGDDFSPGEVIWLDELETVTNTQHQGKGGPSQDFTTFTYFQSIALGICGTYPTEAGGPGVKVLKRVWENGKLVYDIRPQRDDEPTEDYTNRLIMSAVYASTFVFYDGDIGQDPDPTIEAVRGIGNTPGYRGLCYIVYPRRQLLDTQAQRHPSFRFEVGSCTADFTALKVYTSDATWKKPFGLVSADVLAIGGGAGGGAGSIGLGGGGRTGGAGGGGGGASFESIDADDLPSTVSVVIGLGGAGALGYDDAHVPEGPEQTYYLNGECGDDGDDSLFGDFVDGPGGHGGPGGFYQGLPRPPTGGNVSDGLGGIGTLATGGNGGVPSGANGLPGGSTTEDPSPGHPGKPAGAGGGSGAGTGNGESHSGGNGGSGEVNPDAIDPPLDYGAEGGTGGIAGVSPLGGHGASGQATEIDHGGGGGGGGGFPGASQYGVGGDGGNGGFYGAGGGGGACGNGNGFNNSSHPPEGHAGAGGTGSKGIVIVNQVFSGDPCIGVNSLGRIVAAICERVGLTQVNTTDIDDLSIPGYALAKQMNARVAIDPLRSVGWFDVAEVGRGIVFVKRGGPVVATLSEDDLGAYESGTSPGPAITTKKTQPTDLPLVVRVHYYAISRDYEFGEQPSPYKVGTTATNEMDVEIPVPLEDQQAAEIAEALWADMWTGSLGTHETTVDRRWIQLTPTDPIVVPVDSELQRMRIVNISDASLLLRKLTLVRDDDDNYEPVAVSFPPERLPTVIASKAPTLMIILDLPPLRPEDDDAGVYVAVRAGSGSTWLGAVIFKSCDLGATWAAQTDQVLASLIGTVVDSVNAGPTAIRDISSTIRIQIPSWSATPESVTFDDIMEGANAFAIGVDGRWEVGQFMTAIQVGATTWELSDLYRGRRGTERFVDTSQGGDLFVLLDPATLTRVPVAIDEVGDECSYRPVTVGTSFDSNADQQVDHENHGEALRPFSPVDVLIARELDDDIAIEWTRRDRLVFTFDMPLPMNEATEAWEIDVLEAGASPENVLRTIIVTGTDESATYTAAQQVADGTDLVVTLEFRVYQISDTVGRGAPAIVIFEG